MQRSAISFADIPLAFDNLRAQKTRTVLTALGIVFGVGSVIGMLAIGAGAQEESLAFIERLGVRNMLVESIPASSLEEMQQRRRSSPGLTERDVRILEANIDSLELLSPRRTLHPARVLPKPSQSMPNLYGVRESYAHHPQHASVGRPLLFASATIWIAPRSASWAIARKSACSATARARRANSSR